MTSKSEMKRCSHGRAPNEVCIACQTDGVHSCYCRCEEVKRVEAERDAYQERYFQAASDWDDCIARVRSSEAKLKLAEDALAVDGKATMIADLQAELTMRDQRLDIAIRALEFYADGRHFKENDDDKTHTGAAPAKRPGKRARTALAELGKA